MKRLLLIALCSVACVTTAQEGEQMRADIAALRADLKKEMDATSGDRQKDQQRAKALQDALDQLSRAARKSGADLAVDLEKAQNDLSSLRGQIEVLQHRLDALVKIGMSFQAQGDCQNALLFFDEILQAHKAAPAAKAAHDHATECRRKNQSRKRKPRKSLSSTFSISVTRSRRRNFPCACSW